MLKIKQIKFFGVLIAILLLVWAIFPLINGQRVNNEVIATSIVFFLLAIGYLIVLFKPEWLKAVLFFEGVIFAVTGFMLLNIPYNYIFLFVGIIIVIIAILAYLRKLPNSLLKFFYRN